MCHPPSYLLMCLFCNHSLKSDSMVLPTPLRGRCCIKRTRRASRWSVGIRRENVLIHNMWVLYQKKILHGCFSWLKTSWKNRYVQWYFGHLRCTTFLSVGFLLFRFETYFYRKVSSLFIQLLISWYIHSGPACVNVCNHQILLQHGELPTFDV